MLLKVLGEAGQKDEYVRISPVVPKSGVKSYDTPSLPEWQDLVCGFNGTQKGRCIPSDSAKQLWTKGKVVDVRFAHEG